MATSAESSIRNLRDTLSVGRKLAVAFGLVGLVVVALALVTFAAISRLDAAEALDQQAERRLEISSGLQHRAALMRAEQLSYVVGRTNDRASFEAAAGDFEAKLHELSGLATTPAEVALVRKITTGYQTFLALDQFVWEAALTGRGATAHNLALGPAALDFGFMAADADLFAAEALSKRDLTRNSFKKTRDQARIIVGAFGILALVLVAAASRYMTRRIRDPLLEVQRAAVEAANGNLEAEAPVRGTDETAKLATAFNSMLRRLRIRESSILEEHERGQLVRQIEAGLDLAETEEDTCQFVGRALEGIAPERSTELLLADNSRAHFAQAVVAGPSPEGPGCRVSSPYSCPAVRAATALTFDDSNSLDACPHLTDRSAGPCSATCVPVSFMGRALGVLHSTGPIGEDIREDLTEVLETLARSTARRIGVMRTTARTQLHASTDGLTGLLNRRTFETKVRAMHRRAGSFTLVMADLDHFKILNDTYGHEAGDKALRMFSQVLQETVREHDVVSRWGGEEFAIAFVDADLDETSQAIDRLRVELHGRLATSSTNPFTASFGYVDARVCDTFESAIRQADIALYQAKASGRDRAVAGTAETPGPASAANADYTEPLDEFDAAHNL